MKRMTLKHDQDAGVKTFVSPTLKCQDCKTNRFVPPTMLCAFCPECPEAQCGPCSIEHGPYNHTVCPKCKITLCLEHAYCEMEDNGTDELGFGMTSPIATRRGGTPRRPGSAATSGCRRARPRPSRRPRPRVCRGGDASALTAPNEQTLRSRATSSVAGVARRATVPRRASARTGPRTRKCVPRGASATSAVSAANLCATRVGRADIAARPARPRTGTFTRRSA